MRNLARYEPLFFFPFPFEEYRERRPFSRRLQRRFYFLGMFLFPVGVIAVRACRRLLLFGRKER